MIDANYHGVGGIGPPVFAHGVGGIGPPVLATNQGVGGIGPPVLASAVWVVNAFRPTALVRTSSTKATTINHLFIDPPKRNYGSESIGGLMPSKEFLSGMCRNGTHPRLPGRARAFRIVTRSK